MASTRTATTPVAVIRTRRDTMKKVRIKLKWEWKLEGAWAAAVIMVVLLKLPNLPPSWLGLG